MAAGKSVTVTYSDSYGTKKTYTYTNVVSSADSLAAANFLDFVSSNIFNTNNGWSIVDGNFIDKQKIWDVE